MDWRKAALWTGGTVALLLAAAAICLHLLVDPDRLKKAARDKALAAWERELLMGDVRLDLFPLPALRANQVSLSNPAWAKDPHLVAADLVRAELELLPLLVGKVRIKRLSLEGLKAGLEVAEDGGVSWQLGRTQPNEPRTEAETEEEALHVAAIHIRNADIVFRKQKRPDATPWRIQEAVLESQPGLKDVRLDARIVRFDRPLHVKGHLADLSRLGQAGAVSQGTIELDWGAARFSASGTLPLERSLKGQDLGASLKAQSIHEIFAFFGIERSKTAPAQVSLRAAENGGRIEIKEIVASLGQLRVTGDATVTRGKETRIAARLQSDRVDWLKALAEAGGTIKPPRNDGEVFHEDRVAWRAVTAIGALDGTADLAIGSLKLGNGIEIRKLRTQVKFGDGRMEMAPFAGEMLGGSARGALRFDGNRKSLRFELDGDNLLLERWFHERGSKVPFKGGPMTVTARLDLAGETYRALAASVTGPLRIRMGKGTWNNPRAGEAEEKMVSAFLPKDGTDVAFECAAANIGFRAGQASGNDLIGARSDVSQLIVSGTLDARSESLDLRGRVVPRRGSRIGLASFAGEVQIGGKFAKPTIQLDPAAAPAVLARAGAAIASAGVTVIGTALIDSAESRIDPCEKVGGEKRAGSRD